MIADELIFRIRQAFAYPLTPEQASALDTFVQFMTDRRAHVVMVLRGSAGTGKTTLAGAMVRGLASVGQKLMLLAPTGRAAKVFSLNAGQPAYTIHRRIYRQRTAGDLSSFNLNDNLHRDTLFIIDEASMISNQGYGDASFGSGCLLDDLVHYVYQGENCRMMLIGDTAQLPPVGEEESPALLTPVLQAYGLTVYESTLNEVLRQSQESGILYNATRIRSANLVPQADVPRIRFRGFPDICVVPGDELIESLATSYSHVGTDDTIVVTRSNKRANIYNQGIRRTVLDREDELCRGDQLMVVKNNYFWGTSNLLPPTSHLSPPPSTFSPLPSHLSPLTFIANGDRAVVQRVRNIQELYGMRFAEVTIQLPDYDDCELTVTALLDTLTADAPALTREQQEQLFNSVMDDYAHIPLKADRLKQLRQDRYYNALQVKFGYAVTCHKAQGGQWAHVYVDQGYMTDDMLTPDYYHWLYTAFTRATDKLFLVNWPKTQTEDPPTEE